MNSTAQTSASALRKQIRLAKNAVGVAEILYGYNSPERVAAIVQLVTLQTQLDNLIQSPLSQ